ARQLYLSVQGPFTGFNTAETETFPRREYQASDIVRWMTNRHQVSIGGEYGYGQGDIAGNFRANGRFYFEHAAGFTGYAPADFLLGKFSRFQQSSGEFKQTRFHRFALFAQDTMRLSPRVTLGVGVRWEPFFPFSDKIGRLAGWNPGKQSTRFVNAPPNILYAGDPGIPAGVYKTAWKNFAPRVSLAFDLTGDGKTSLRLGYGLFYDTPNTISTNGQANQAPFGSSVTIRGTDVNSMSEPYAGFPGGNPFTLVGISAFGTSALIPPRDARFVLPMSATVDSMTNRNPYSQAWNLTLERELASSLVTRISYAGSKGTALLGGRDINAPLPDATASTATIDLRRPLYPNYTDVSLLESVGNSSFHSLQLTLEKRFSAGFSLLGNYMWSKSIDNNVGSANKGNGTSVTNPLNQRFDRGLSDFDKASVFNLSALWEIPVHLRNPLAAGILNNWNLSAIVAAQSGFPFTVLSGEDNARNDQGPQRADLVGNPKFSGGRSKGDKIAEWLRVDAFVPNALGTYGTLGRNTYRGPSMTNVDLGIQKRFPISENIVTEFRAEAFNVFNHTNLMNPINEMTETDFMRITDARDPRILQFALRVTW
ncbi:MAG: TonB-dependent receptor, partial [Bryobacterales bacterium]|nr:TonB-dependent receptor [Bryobacterales bacterium]